MNEYLLVYLYTFYNFLLFYEMGSEMMCYKIVYYYWSLGDFLNELSRTSYINIEPLLAIGNTYFDDIITYHGDSRGI